MRDAPFVSLGQPDELGPLIVHIRTYGVAGKRHRVSAYDIVQDWRRKPLANVLTQSVRAILGEELTELGFVVEKPIALAATAERPCHIRDDAQTGAAVRERIVGHCGQSLDCQVWIERVVRRVGLVRGPEEQAGA